ncbi:hypothetical protein ACRCPS_31220 [Pseudomonas aeruginosa]
MAHAAPEARTITQPKAMIAYATFVGLLCGMILAAGYLLPAELSKQLMKMMLAVWPLLFMADQATARHFSQSFLRLYLLPGIRAGFLFTGLLVLLNSLGFDTYPGKDDSAFELVASLFAVAFMGATSSAIVRIFIWSGFEMIGTHLSAKRS